MTKRESARSNDNDQMKLFMKRAVGLGISVLTVLLLQIDPGFGEGQTMPPSPANDTSSCRANENAILTQAPAVPPPITRRQPAKVMQQRIGSSGHEHDPRGRRWRILFMLLAADRGNGTRIFTNPSVGKNPTGGRASWAAWTG